MFRKAPRRDGALADSSNYSEAGKLLQGLAESTVCEVTTLGGAIVARMPRHGEVLEEVPGKGESSGVAR